MYLVKRSELPILEEVALSQLLCPNASVQGSTFPSSIYLQGKGLMQTFWLVEERRKGTYPLKQSGKKAEMPAAE